MTAPDTTALGFVRFKRIQLTNEEFCNVVRRRTSVLVAPGSHLGAERYFRITHGIAPVMMVARWSESMPVEIVMSSWSARSFGSNRDLRRATRLVDARAQSHAWLMPRQKVWWDELVTMSAASSIHARRRKEQKGDCTTRQKIDQVREANGEGIMSTLLHKEVTLCSQKPSCLKETNRVSSMDVFVGQSIRMQPVGDDLCQSVTCMGDEFMTSFGAALRTTVMCGVWEGFESLEATIFFEFSERQIHVPTGVTFSKAQIREQKSDNVK
ncbi:hypothetical protein M427DRAFT_43454 [Gonapodya prolifera JEL478]|uniref:Uncharacterized protein n=1 Tax=Gonapodya prolifera (strain JEL478) TaxID=1344416 RepID=A0A139AJJ4_GONPJ|nr:hypothetical protein M427DRAFT_43454 [Gonapodya prolifera JEL478]|eukprot:KXS16653.1 hypothetical protein M427DRAFT_43454 [Gonapodya prolifera JEL478]